jgi:hypothetical protein
MGKVSTLARRAWAEMIAAMRAGAAYVNVHTTVHPSREIRARLGPATDDEDQGD